MQDSTVKCSAVPASSLFFSRSMSLSSGVGANTSVGDDVNIGIGIKFITILTSGEKVTM
jgi:hypothetical protein